MKIRIRKNLDELFALPGPGSKKKRYNIIDEEEIVEMYSTAGTKGHFRIKISPEREHKGHVERSKRQGLRNVVQEDQLFEDTEVMISEMEQQGLAPVDPWMLKERMRALIRSSGLMLKDVLDMFISVWNEVAQEEEKKKTDIMKGYSSMSKN